MGGAVGGAVGRAAERAGGPLDLDKELVGSHMHGDFLRFRDSETLDGVIDALRSRADEGKVTYYYVVDSAEALIGVLPARLLVTRDSRETAGAACLKGIVTIGPDMSLGEAAAVFERHRYLSLPVVDGERRILGVLDLHVFARRELDIADRGMLEEAFQTIGIRLSALLRAGVGASFRLRFPWLVSTLAGGTLCALISSAYEATLMKSVMLSLFLSMILALGESTAIQSMTIVFQLLHSGTLRTREAMARVAREAAAGILLGLACGAAVLGLSAAWKGLSVFGLIFLASVTLSITTACVVGAAVPWVLHRLRANVKVAAGPIVLALADSLTIVIYLGIASLLLG